VSFVDSSNSNAVISDISLGSASSQVYLPKSYPTGTNPRSLAIADFNGDGIPDLVIANYGDNNVSILLGKGDGTFQAPKTYPAGSNPWSVAVGDFNMDGIPDIVVANWADHTLSVLLGNGDGTFQAQTKYPVGDGPLSSPVSGTLSLAVADVNQDGKPDIVVGMDSNSYISVLLGNGDGTFQAQKQSPLPDGASSLAIADFNGDGKPDIAVGISGNTTLDILLGNGDGTFQAGESYVLDSYPDALAVGDFNGDGKPDLAISLGGNATVAAYVGNGDGTFQTPHIYQLSSGTPESIAVADTTLNGKQDIIVNTFGGSFNVLLGNGDGTFQPPAVFSSNGGDSAIRLADFNGDGRPDIVVPASVLLNALTSQATTSAVSVVGGAATHTVNATYSGDSVYAPSTSNSESLARGISTSLQLTGNATGIVTVGTSEQLTAALTPSTYNGASASGTVTFSDNGTAIGAPVSISSSGQATLKTGALTAGGHSFSAAYSGDSNFAAAQSGSVALWATIPSSTTLSVSSNSVSPGTAILFTATVKDQNNAAISHGQVQFCNAASTYCEGSSLLGTAELNATGTATLNLRLGVGTYSIDAIFMGTAAGQPSKSTAQNVAVVGKTWSASALTLGGIPGNYTLTDTETGGGSTAPTGAVSFEDISNANATVATVVLDNTTAQITLAESKYSGAYSYSPKSVAVADLNGDGIPDIIAANESNGTIDVFLGNGDGTFQAAKSFQTGPTSNTIPTAVVVGDFNGDGKLDVAVSDSVGAIRVLLGNGDGTFQPEQTINVGTSYLAVADFNGDGKLDLATPSGVLLGNGDGTFHPLMSFASIPGASAIAVGDFNGDGIPDLAVLSAHPSDAIAVLLGNGDGTFQSPKTYPAGIYPIVVAVGDFNGDGKTDLAVANVEGVSVLLGNGDGTFQSQTQYTVNVNGFGADSWPSDLTIGDFDGDGKLDIAESLASGSAVLENNGVTFTGSGGVAIFRGNGDGTFQSVNSTYDAGDWRAVAMGDFNGDGRMDLAIASPTNGSVYALLNEWAIQAAAKQVFVVGGPATHSIVAAYPGDTSYQSSTSNAVTIVRGVSTGLALVAIPSGNQQPGQTIQLTATVTPATYNGSAASGNITFYDNNTAISTQPLASGQAAFTTAGLSAGGHSFTAAYSGDSNFAPATSLSQVVWASSSTTTSLTVSSNSVSAGTPVTFTSTVTYQGNAPVPGGMVEFCDASATYCEGSALLGTASLTATGKASASLRLGIGSYNIKAVFVGNAGGATSTSSTQAVTITGQLATSTALAESGAPGRYTLVTTVTGSARGEPTGSVTIEDTSNANSTVATALLSSTTASVAVVPNNFQTGNGPRALAWADLNGDGKPDMVVANRSDNTVSVLLGKGDGTFQSQATYTVGTQPTSVAIGDFNGDGKLDLAVSNYSDNTVGILLGNGDGTFQLQKTYATGKGPSVVVIADLNGDGKMDLAVTNYNDNTVDVLLGNGDGTFQAATASATGGQPSCVAVGDLNGDGRPDLVTCDSVDNTISVLLGKGDGTFQPRVTYAVGYTPYSVAIADLNGDGKQDVTVVNSTIDYIIFPAPTNPISVFLGNGDGTLQGPKTYAVGNVPISITVADFNGDGKPDLAVANRYDNTVSVLLGNGDGSFQPQVTFPTGKEPTSVVAADFTGSGRPDLAIANLSDNTVSVLVAQAQVTATASNVAIVGPSATHAVVAVYGGDSINSSSTSSPVNLTSIPKTTPSVTVSALPNSITTAQSLVATVTVSGTPTPTGSVTITSGSYTSTASTLNSGVATINVGAGSLATGTDTLTANYTPDSTSSPLYNSASGTTTVTVTVAVNPSFALSGTTVTVTPGATTGNTSTITVTPAGGFIGSVALTAALTSSPSGAQYPPTLSFGSTTPVSISGTTAGAATLTVSTTAPTSAAVVYPKRPGVPWYAAGGVTLACFLLFGIPARRRSWRTMLGLLVLLVFLAGGVLSCGGGGSGGGGGGGTSNPGTTAGAYTVTVTGTSGSLTQTTTLTVTVN
jgi:protocatechuate 3,4-dioxygenase beta subunit